jgi:hypothetical protein
MKSPLLITLLVVTSAISLRAEQIVISEIMYNPAPGLPEYIEVQNITSTPFDIASWQLTDGVEFSFPPFSAGSAADSFLKAFERFIISSVDETTLRNSYTIPVNTRVFGPWSGSLSNSGETITLNDKNGVTRTTVRYNNKGKWPAAADGGGHSLVMTNINTVNDDYRSWSFSKERGGTPGFETPVSAEESFPNPEIDLSTGIPYIQYGDKWDFNDQNIDLGTTWKDTNYNYSHSGWTLQGAGGNNGGLYGFENSALPAPGIQTALLDSPTGDNHMSYYFRKTIEYSGPTTGVTLTVDTINDDGAGFYLNGQWIGGNGTSANAAHGDTANRTIGEAAEELGIISITSAPLVSGTNVIAVAGKQTNASSSDFVFGARISISAPSAPSIVINEVLPAGTGTGFVEFYNPTAATINLGGYYLSDTPGNLTKYQIPGTLNVTPTGLASVGFTESSLTLASPTVVYLTAPNGTTVVNGINANMTLDGRSLGRKPEGGGIWYLFTSPSRDGSNSSSGGLSASIAINEAHFDVTGNADWVELTNKGTSPLSTSGLFIASLPDFSDKVALSGNIAAGGFASWTTNFPTSGGDLQLFVINGSNTVLTAANLTNKNGRNFIAAYPDGSSNFLSSGTGSQDAANNPDRNEDIVINEIMVEPVSGHRDGEFIELYNKGTSTVSLTGWEFSNGVNYIFPSGTSLGAGNYLVIAANPTLTSSAFPSANVIGPYSGNLANSGELLTLIDEWDNVADELHYHTAGDWPALASGLGSSLELRHPDMDNSMPTAWEASDESNKSTFQNFTFTETYQQLKTGGGVTDYEELHLFGVGDAHIALKNVSLSINGSNTNILPGGGETVSHNGNGSTGWLCQGTHYASDSFGDEFHVISSGHGDNKANRCEIDVTQIAQNNNLTFSCDARWISGKPTLVVYTWDRSFGDVLHLPVPPNLGTAGAANSSALASPAPTVASLRHSPAVPLTSEPVTITARVNSATALTSVNVHHRPDSANNTGSYQTTAMNDSGTNGDDRAGDGIYSATLTQYQSDNQIVQFYVQANSAGGSSIAPGLAPEKPAMWVVDNSVISTDLRLQRFVVSSYDINALGGTGETATYDYDFPRLSNQYFNSTFIGDDKEVIYNCEIRKSGSPWTRAGNSDLARAKWKTPGDKRFRGYSKRSIDNDATGNRAYHGRIIRYWLYLFGHAANENEFVQVILNGGSPTLREDLEPNANDFLKRNWVDGEKGELYRIDDDWYFEDNWNRSQDNATWAFKNSSHEPERYLGDWIKRSRETEYDYSSFTTWVSKVGTNTFTREEIERMADIDMMAANSIARGWCDDWDTLTRSRGKNGYFLRRYSDGKWQLVQWDSDLTFGSSNAAFFGDLTGVRNFFDKPYVRQRVNYYLGKMISDYAATGPRLQAWFDCEEDASSAYSNYESTYTNWHNARVGLAQTEIGAAFSTNFNVTTGNGSSTTTTADTITLSGTSGYQTFSLRVVGHPEAVWNFSTQTAWTLSDIQLREGANVLTVEAVDENGNVVGSEVYTVNKTGNALPVVDIDASPGSFNVDLSETLTLDASASYDPELTPLSFAWSVSPSSGTNLTNITSPSANSTFGAPGLYNFTVVATDGNSQTKTVTREAAVYAASGWSSFTDPLLASYWTTENLEVRDGDSPGAYYSLDDRPGSLALHVLDDSAKPLTMSNPKHPALWRNLPTATDWSLHSDVALDSSQQGDFITGVIAELSEAGTATRYVIALEDGDFLRVKRATGGSYTQLYTANWSKGSTPLRIRRSGNQLHFEHRTEPGVWVNIHTRAIPSGTTATKGGIFAASDIARNVRFTYDYILLVDPGLSNDYLDALRITEVMYNAPGGTGVEYIEIMNTGTVPIDLAGVSFDAGAPFDPLTLPSYTLQPGERVIITNNSAAFIAAYGAGPTILTTWSGGAISNNGEEIILRDPSGNIIHRFDYDNNNGWATRADGGGSSLEVIDTEGDYNDPNNWRASTEFGGTPGTAGSGPTGALVITEILTHTDVPNVDTIEIKNTTGADIDISGWYLSDSDVNWQKFLIPANTLIPAGDYLTFDETDFNPNGLWNTNAGPPAAWEFAISSHGDQVYLIEASGSTPIAYAADRDFDAAKNGVSFGTYLNSQDEEFFTAQAAQTFGTDNIGPLVGPIVITEIMYQNAPGQLDWIEIQNIRGTAIPLNDTGIPANVWKVSGIGFDFPTGEILSAGGVALIVSGDPATFRAQYSIDPSIAIYGPYNGNLQDNGEMIRLQMPEPAEALAKEIDIDYVRYDIVSPWPTGALGSGYSIERIFVDQFGTEPLNWQLSSIVGGTPGISSLPPLAPRIDSNVGSVNTSVTFGQDAGSQIFSVSNTGVNTLSYSINESVNWMSIAPAFGTSTGLADITNHTITFSTSGLTAGTHNADITVTDAAADNSPFTIPVTVTIIQPDLMVGTSSVNVVTQQGQDAAGTDFTIWNQETGSTMSYSLTTDMTWLGVTPAAGTSTGPGEVNSHSVTFSSASLPIGNYSGNIIITAPGSTNSPEIIPVNLTISDGVIVCLDSRGLTLGPVSTWDNTGSLGSTFNAEIDVPVASDVIGVRAVTLDGTDDRYVGPIAPAGVLGNNPHTIEAWIYNPSVGGGAAREAVFSWGRQSGGVGGIVSLNHSSDDNTGAVEHWGNEVSLGWANQEETALWTLLSYTYDGSGRTVAYINGIEVNSMGHDPLNVPGTGIGNVPLPFVLGAQNLADGTRDNIVAASISVAQIKVYENALDATNIESNYNIEALNFGRTPTPNADLDGDGLSTAQESTYGTDPNLADTDGDGLTDGQEVALGTDPLDANSIFKVESISINPTTGDVTIDWGSAPGRNYRLEYSHNLVDWFDVNNGISIPSGGSSTSYTDPDPATTEPHTFYRAVLVP